MGMWALLLVVGGLVLTVLGANQRMAARLGETSANAGRLVVRTGLGALALGIALFAVSVVVHTVITVLTLVAVLAVAVGAVSLVTRVRRPRQLPGPRSAETGAPARGDLNPTATAGGQM